MVILGIDPGWDRCGWAKIGLRGNDVRLLNSGLITTKRQDTKAQRLNDLYKQISILLHQNPQPECVAIEEIHLPPQGVRISNLLKLGEARGVLLLAANQRRLRIQEIHPLVVKSTITGYARSSKAQVAQFLKCLLKDVRLNGVDDTTDAIAIALTCALTTRVSYLLSPSP